MKPYYQSDAATVYCADCREVLPTLEPVDATVCDPPYGISFMGKGWDRGVPGMWFWQVVIDAMKPGAHLLAFGGTRTFHRLTCAIEDAGFEIRDCLMYIYGSGMPKSHSISKAIDKAAGWERQRIPKGKPVKRIIPGADQNKRGWKKDSGREYQPADEVPATDAAKQWEGWGTSLKPSWEPIILARKPLSEKTVAANVLKHGTGALNIDGCRVTPGESVSGGGCNFNAWRKGEGRSDRPSSHKEKSGGHNKGRWPANLILDGSEEVLAGFPDTKGGKKREANTPTTHDGPVKFGYSPERHQFSIGDSGSASRFFYCAKVGPSERGDSDHPTMKPIALMRYLCRLVTPPGGVVLDPFMGSGSTLIAAYREGFPSIGVELEVKYCDIVWKRLAAEDPDVTSETGGETK